MSLIVYGAPLSPFVRKVRLLLAEKGLEYQLEYINPFGQPDDFQQISPLKRVPALRDGDLTLADSSVICQYLEEQYPQHTPLYGQNAVERARVRWLEKYADYEVAPAATFGVFRNRLIKPAVLSQPSDEGAVQRALETTLPPLFDYLEQQLGDRQYFVGNRLSLADLAVAVQLVNLEHGGETLDAGRWPNLGRFYARIKARDSMQGVLPGELKVVGKLRALAATR
ncbi:glutathione S-transferase family protein [Pseudomonas sp. N040]|uniref:glutathione S-transferase family protein n=1 Tax=Pseudomonas sp. N040 TaxID=2785325 RepID=UPI0018A321FF|nr:glutathione S-transferase family protein [Pseudomonas sp. N040]MBF7730820.1 glutathione S-transferase family protein [Pseudomonas sp. N040]MBW7014463.1 glutathione S-transferase family protein [Pseudomonas sp. N040]